MMEINTSLEGNYSIIKEDPKVLIQLVDKFVTCRLIKNSSFTGFVHSIDPLSSSIILSVPQEDKHQIVLIPGHAILHVLETEVPPNTKLPFWKSALLETSSDNTAKKEKIMKWLKSNLLPVTEEGDTIVFGNARILPPYNVTDICTDNPMVAIQMRKVLEIMPDNFESM